MNRISRDMQMQKSDGAIASGVFENPRRVATILMASLALVSLASSPMALADDAQPAEKDQSSGVVGDLLEQIGAPSGDATEPAAPPADSTGQTAAKPEEKEKAGEPAELDMIPVDLPKTADAKALESAGPKNAPHLEEIVVTATKRSQSVEEIPTTINVLSGDNLESQGIRQLSEFIDQVPGIKMQEQSGTGPRKVAVRGVGPDDTTNQTVGTVLGDVPLGDPFGSYTIVDPDPFDLQTVEVLKGPQGSLFGASSLSGLIRYVPNTPVLETWAGKGFAQWTSIQGGGSDPTYGAMVNVPVGTTLAFRGAGVIEHAPGYIDYNTPGYVKKNADQSHKWFGRAMMRWQPTEELNINVMGMSQQAHGEQFAAVTNPDYKLERNDAPTANPYRRGFQMGAVDARYTFDWATLVSLTGYQHKINKFNQDITYNFFAEPAAQAGLDLVHALRDVEAHGFSQELRLVSPDEGPWTWLGGVVYSNYKAAINSDVYVPQAAIATQALVSLLTPLGLGDLAAGVGNENGLTIGRQVFDPMNAKEKAVFGEVTREIGDVKITLGGRLYKTSVDGTAKASGVAATVANQQPVTTSQANVEGKGFSPKAAVTWQLDENILVYSSAARGYQFGGINVVPIPIDKYPPTYKSSTLWSYEAGIRTDWLDNTLKADLSVFYLDWKNAQVTQVGQSSADSWVDNVGVVKSKGLEGTLRYLLPIDGLTLEINGAYTQAKTAVAFVNSQGNTVASGTDMPNSSPLQTSTTLAYSTELFTSWRASSALLYTHSGAAWNDINHDARIEARDILNFNLSLGYADGYMHPTIGFVVANLTNQIKKVSVGAGPADTALAKNPVVYSPPRTFQVKASFDF